MVAAGYAAALGTAETERIGNSQIEDSCARRNQVAQRLMTRFQQIERGAVDLKQLELEETDAFTELFAFAAKRCGSYSSAKDLISVTRCIRVAKNVSDIVLRNGGYVWKGMRYQSETLM